MIVPPSLHDTAFNAVKKAEDEIPAKHWISIPPETAKEWDELLLTVRLELRDTVKAYDGTMLKGLRKLRCAEDNSRAECFEPKE